MRLRSGPRIYVRYSATVQTDNGAGAGTLFDLSTTGCRIQSNVALTPGSYLALHFEAPQTESPIEIEVSIVRWCKDGQFGVEFLRYGLGTRERVMNLVQTQPVTAPAETLAPAEPTLAAVSG
jgi:hypothetical protein